MNQNSEFSEALSRFDWGPINIYVVGDVTCISGRTWGSIRPAGLAQMCILRRMGSSRCGKLRMGTGLSLHPSETSSSVAETKTFLEDCGLAKMSFWMSASRFTVCPVHKHKQRPSPNRRSIPVAGMFQDSRPVGQGYPQSAIISCNCESYLFKETLKQGGKEEAGCTIAND